MRSLRFASLLLAGFLMACVAEKPVDTAEPLNAGSVVRIADKLRAQGDLPMAEEFYRRALIQSDGDIAAYLGMAAIYEQRNNAGEAGRYYLEAIKHDGRNTEARRGYARLLMAGGQYAAAVEQYRALLARDGDDTKALNGLGVALDQLGEHAAAMDQYNRALKVNPDDLTAVNNIGLSLIMAGNYQDAVARLAPAADALKATPSLRQNLALAYVMNGQDGAAHGLLRRDLGEREAARVLAQLRQQRTALAAAAPVAPVAAATPKAAPHQVAAAEEPEDEPPPPRAAPVAKVVMKPMSAKQALANIEPLAGIKIDRAAVHDIVPTAKTLAVKSPAPKKPAIPVSQAAAKPAPMPEPKPVAAVTPQPVPPVAESEPKPPAKPEFVRQAIDPIMPQKLASGAHHVRRAAPAHPAVQRPDDGAIVRATLGPYPTAMMAAAAATRVKDEFADDLPPKALVNAGAALNADSLPQFVVYVYGFGNRDAADGFCRRMRRNDQECGVR